MSASERLPEQRSGPCRDGTFVAFAARGRGRSAARIRKQGPSLVSAHHTRAPGVAHPMDRARRNASAQRAYEAQVRAGTEGLVKFTGLGVGLAILGHYTWPFFRCVALALSCGGC